MGKQLVCVVITYFRPQIFNLLVAKSGAALWNQTEWHGLTQRKGKIKITLNVRWSNAIVSALISQMQMSPKRGEVTEHGGVRKLFSIAYFEARRSLKASIG